MAYYRDSFTFFFFAMGDITIITLYNSQDVLCSNCSQYKSCCKHCSKTWAFHENCTFQLQKVYILANFCSPKESMVPEQLEFLRCKNYTFLQLKDKNCKTNPVFLFEITEHLNNWNF
jgi:hypothetical protein